MQKKGFITFFIIIVVIVLGITIKIYSPHVIKTNSKDNFKGFNFKKIKKINYGDYNLEDYIKEEVSCDEDACTFQDFQIEYEFTEHANLGKQKVELKLQYKNKEYKNTFNVNIVDTEKPYINLSSDEVEVKTKSKFNIEDYIIEVYDNYDKDLKDKLVINSNVNTKIKGDYIVRLSVEDSSGNKTTTKMKVKVVDSIKKVYPTKNNTDKQPVSETKIPPCSHDLLHEENNSIDTSSINIKIWSNVHPRLTVKKTINDITQDITDTGHIYLFKDTVLNISTKLFNGNPPLVSITNPDKEIEYLKLNDKGYTKYLINKLGLYHITITYKIEENIFNYNYDLLVKDEEKLSELSYKLYTLKNKKFISFKFNEGIGNLKYNVYIYETNDEKLKFVDGKYELKVARNNTSFKYEKGKYYKIKAIVMDKYNNVKTLDFKIEK